jgi:hypothetical protein
MVQGAAKKVYRTSLLEGITSASNPRTSTKDLEKLISSHASKQGAETALKEQVATSRAREDAAAFLDRQLTTTIKDWRQYAEKLADIFLIEKGLEHIVPPDTLKEILEARERYLDKLDLLGTRQVKKRVVKLVTQGLKGDAQARALSRSPQGTPSLRIGLDESRVIGRLINAGFMTKDKRPKAQSKLCPLEDHQIVDRFAFKARGLLSYYRCTDNI